MGNESLYLLAFAVTGQLPTPKSKKEEGSKEQNPLDRLKNETEPTHPQYGNIFGKTPKADPDYKKGLTGSQPATPSYDGFFGKTPATTPNYDKAVGQSKGEKPSFDGFFGKTPTTAPDYNKAVGQSKGEKPNFDGFFGKTPTTTPDYDKAFSPSKGEKPDFNKLFQGSSTKPDYSTLLQTKEVSNTRMTELYTRQFGPAPARTTELGWERVDALEYVSSKESPGTYVNPDPKIPGALVIDYETGSVFYIPKPGTSDKPETKDVDESKPALAEFNKDSFKWINSEIPKRTPTAAKHNLIRTTSGHYQNRDTRDKTIWYLQNNGTYWTPEKHDPNTGKLLGAGTLDSDNFLTDEVNQKPLAGTTDIVELNLFQVADNKFQQIDVPGHFEIGSDGFIHYKGQGVPQGGKKGDDSRGPQFYDSSDPKISEHTWKPEKK